MSNVELKDLVTVKAEFPSDFKFTFKNKELNRESQELLKQVRKANELVADVETRAAAIRIAQAKVLGRVMAGKLYEEDGFKSVKEYAFKTFNINEQTAYKLAQAGVRFYNNESETAKVIVTKFGKSPLNMNEFGVLTDEQLQAGLDSGEIKDTFTQKEIRAYVDTVQAKDETAKRVPAFNIQMALTTVSDDGNATTTYKNFNGVVGVGTAATLAAWIGDKWTAYKTPVKAVNGDTVYLAMNETGNEWARVQVKKREDGKSGKAKTANIREVTAEQLAEIFGLDLETARAMKAKQAERDAK